MSADDEFCKCGQPNYHRERKWYAANFARLVQDARRGDSKAQRVVDRSTDLVIVQNRLGTLCGSAEGASAIEALMLAVRDVMPAKDLPS